MLHVLYFSTNFKMICEKIKSGLQAFVRYHLHENKVVQKFMNQCAKVTWQMVIQHPPMWLSTNFMTKNTIYGGHVTLQQPIALTFSFGRRNMTVNKEIYLSKVVLYKMIERN